MSHAICHPDSWELLRPLIAADLEADPDQDVDTIPVCTSLAAPRCFWKFPADPFVEYEPDDEAWCRFFGIGAEDPSRPWFAIVRPAPVFIAPVWEPPPPPPMQIHFMGPFSGLLGGGPMVQLP